MLRMGSGMMYSTITAHALQNLIQILDHFVGVAYTLRALHSSRGVLAEIEPRPGEGLKGVRTVHDDILFFDEGPRR